MAIKTRLGNGEEEKNQTGALLVEGSRHGRRKPPALLKGLEAAVEHRLRIRLIFRAWGEPAPCSLHRPGSFGAGISSHQKKMQPFDPSSIGKDKVLSRPYGEKRAKV